ncbi:MAG: hypothetical protein K6E29_01425 [Cyanobacteria bacterium RUI128]|nr:hypothetical protein [Cyanobacteria bacterium RUI128]
MKQAGSVKLHEQNAISDDLYNQLKSAQKMIKSHIKGSDLRVDIYDATNAPKDKFVYMREPGSVYIEVTDLLKGETQADEFWEKSRSNEPLLRRIFKFIDKATGYEEPIKVEKETTRRKFYYFLERKKKPAETKTPAPYYELKISSIQAQPYELKPELVPVQERKRISI